MTSAGKCILSRENALKERMVTHVQNVPDMVGNPPHVVTVIISTTRDLARWVVCHQAGAEWRINNNTRKSKQSAESETTTQFVFFHGKIDRDDERMACEHDNNAQITSTKDESGRTDYVRARSALSNIYFKVKLFSTAMAVFRTVFDTL